MSWVATAGAAIAVVAVVGCEKVADEPGPVSCEPPSGLAINLAPPPQLSLAVVAGKEDDTQTRVVAPWHDGDHVPLLRGGQGGLMVRPALDVTATAPLLEDAAHTTCLAVQMAAGPPDNASLLIYVRAARASGATVTYHVPALFGLLTYTGDVDRFPVDVTFDVQELPDAGRQTVNVVPDSTVSP